ncbi:hydroxymethylbilane synthase [Arthrobacter sp. HMSC08H08]|uniref:hydroxymethylbilane synthase n=1 Tax=Arthrobacter sp. HMSC08H08 TaxID=1581143 RepID=UPI0008A46B44|nr:hydroxymethylbilane synthase [Arthrobacter sp. HMSC08H08]OFT23844.1 hydroxymethylbilane synthase [Arthrobacter sp. HMSC08H08]
MRIGTRASKLALTQAAWAADLTVGKDRFELVHVTTKGDTDRRHLSQIGGTGVFVNAVREALLNKEVDAVVHSLKDLPTAPEHGIALACIPHREDVTDALCSRDGMRLADLPAGASVGTGSPRRAAQLRAIRPDLQVVPIRGNVDTRLAKVTDGELDGVVLATAGLNRLGLEGHISERFDPKQFLPAPAQGALALEIRAEAAEGTWYGEALTAADHADTRAAVLAERSLLRTLEAGCSAPVGAYATVEGGVLTLRGGAFATDGSQTWVDHVEGPAENAVELGAVLAQQLLDAGAGTVLNA